MSLLDVFRKSSSRRKKAESPSPAEGQAAENRPVSPPSPSEARRRAPAQPRPKPTPIPPRPRPALEEGRVPPAATGPRPVTTSQPVAAEKPASAPPAERSRGRGINPGLRLRAIEAAAREPRPKRLPLLRRIFRLPEGKLTMQAYWTVTATISLIVNAILIAALLVLSRYVYVLSTRLANELLYTGLYESFGAMDAASIRTQIPINTTVHASIPVQINQTTDVVLTRNTTIRGASVSLSTGGLEIVQAPTNIILPAGTVLPVQLNLTVPVEADIPVTMTVPVNIPLNQTELHGPFVTLRRAVQPYALSFYDPSTAPSDPRRPWSDEPLCQRMQDLCDWWFMEVDFPQP